jgi:hypothetical protein
MDEDKNASFIFQAGILNGFGTVKMKVYFLWIFVDKSNW